MARVIGQLVLSALIVGGATGLLLSGLAGIFVVVPIAIGVAVLLGLPTYLLLRKMGWIAWWQAALAGLVLLSPAAVLAWPYWYPVGLFCLSGVASGLVFWRISMGPNNSFKPNPLRGSA